LIGAEGHEVGLGIFGFTDAAHDSTINKASHEPVENERPTFNIERSTSKDSRFSNSTFGVGRWMFDVRSPEKFIFTKQFKLEQAASHEPWKPTSR